MEQEILQLEKTVAELTQWKNTRIEERLSFPLDLHSRRTLDFWSNKNFPGLLLSTGRTDLPFTNVITDLLAFGLEVMINGQKRIVLVMFELKKFTADAGTDVITNTGGNHNLKNGDLIAFTSDNLLPAGLNSLTEYYVVNRTGTTFKVSLTQGGTPVNITDNGTGTHYYGLQ